MQSRGPGARPDRNAAGCRSWFPFLARVSTQCCPPSANHALRPRVSRRHAVGLPAALLWSRELESLQGFIEDREAP